MTMHLHINVRGGGILDKEKVKVIRYPTYSPDLSPCYLFLFPRHKKMLYGRSYHNESALGSVIHECSNRFKGQITLTLLDNQF